MGDANPLLVLDELHKASGWKRSLEGLYDTLDQPTDVLVAGSARLNVIEKGGDSLLGRAFHFRLHPCSAAELDDPKRPSTPEQRPQALTARRGSLSAERAEHARRLLRFRGFPEPCLRGSERYAQMWRRSFNGGLEVIQSRRWSRSTVVRPPASSAARS